MAIIERGDENNMGDIPPWLSVRIDTLLREENYETLAFRANRVKNLMEGKGCLCRSCVNEAVSSYNQIIVYNYAYEPDNLVKYLMKVDKQGRIVRAIDDCDENGWPGGNDESGSAW